jgi:hypothetical protein
VGGKGERRLLALASKERLIKILEKMLDEDEFLSEYGIRSWVLRVHDLGEGLRCYYVLAYRSFIKISRGGWMSKESATRLAIGLVIQSQECLAGIPTGEVQSVSLL